jgi:hypothetical protein
MSMFEQMAVSTAEYIAGLFIAMILTMALFSVIMAKTDIYNK